MKSVASASNGGRLVRARLFWRRTAPGSWAGPLVSTCRREARSKKEDKVRVTRVKDFSTASHQTHSNAVHTRSSNDVHRGGSIQSQSRVPLSIGAAGARAEVPNWMVIDGSSGSAGMRATRDE